MRRMCRWFGHRWVRCHHCWTYLGNGYSSCSSCGAFYKAAEHWHYANDKPAPQSCRRCGFVA